MRVLIVDDEQNICQGIKKFLISMHYPVDEIATMSDSVEAVGFARGFKPDIVMSDVSMPRLNGFEMIQQIKSFCPDVRVIMVSCYDEIQYLKRAFKLDAIDYIFKPVDVKELNAAFEKAMMMGLSRASDRDAMERSLSRMRERLVSGVLEGESDNRQSIEVSFQKLGFTLAGDRMLAVATIASEGVLIDSKQARPVTGELNERFLGQTPAFALPLHGEIALVAELDGLPGEYNAGMRALLEQVMEHIGELLQIDVHAAVGGFYGNLSDLAVGYRRAFEINCLYPKHRRKIAFYEEVLDYSGDVFLSITREHINSFVHSICMANREGIDNVTDTLMHTLLEMGAPDERAVEQVRIEMSHALQEVFRQLNELCGYRLLDDGLDLLRLSLPVTPGRLMDECKLILYQLFDAYQSKVERTEKLIDQVKMMIETEYMNPQFSVQLIASRIGVGPNYISSVFKQHVGKGINEMITRRRLEEAKQLMRRKELRIADICQMVGYEDQNYFSRLFRKYCGMNPTEHREMVDRG